MRFALAWGFIAITSDSNSISPSNTFYWGLFMWCLNLLQFFNLEPCDYRAFSYARLYCNCFAIATILEPCDYSAFGHARLHCNCFAIATMLEPHAFKCASRWHEATLQSLVIATSYNLISFPSFHIRSRL